MTTETSEQTHKHLGLTSPVSTSEPTKEDSRLTESLELALQPHGVFESEDESQKRLVFKRSNLNFDFNYRF